MHDTPAAIAASLILGLQSGDVHNPKIRTG
jgi:hypothetical protein